MFCHLELERRRSRGGTHKHIHLSRSGGDRFRFLCDFARTDYNICCHGHVTDASWIDSVRPVVNRILSKENGASRLKRSR